MCLHMYSLKSSAFLKYQTRGFYCTWSKSHPLVDISSVYTLQSCVFPRNTGLGTNIFIKLEYIARSLVKIKSIPDWHLFISRMETKWTKWYAMTSHVIAYRSLELLFGTHTFHFNCFFEDFNCVFTQIRYLSRVLTQYNSSLSSLVPNFRILTQVVAEKSLTKKKVYRQTNRQTNKQT